MAATDAALQPMWSLCERRGYSDDGAAAADFSEADGGGQQPSASDEGTGALVVWYAPAESTWHDCHTGGATVSPCPGRGHCADGEGIDARRCVCSDALELPLMGTRARRVVVTHRDYQSRGVLLDEVAAYAAAVHLSTRFFAAFGNRTRRNGGVHASSKHRIEATPADLCFASFTGVLDCGPDVPLRRVDAPDTLWRTTSDGTTSSTTPSSSSSSAAEQRCADMCAALSHFTWSVASGHRAMVEVLQRRGGVVTVAAVHTNTTDGDDQVTFGPHCNGQRAALGRFLQSHRCNEVCRMLSLPPARPLV